MTCYRKLSWPGAVRWRYLVNLSRGYSPSAAAPNGIADALREWMVEYRQLGRSGIAVSSFGLGAMTFGGQTDELDAFRQLDMAQDAGINLFDSAENYPTPISPSTQGKSEEILGRWVKAKRNRTDVVIATKVAGPGNAAGDMSHIRGDGRHLDAKNISQAVEDSLRRLRTDYIDLFQVHWSERPISTLVRSRYSLVPDPRGMVAIEETLGALGRLVQEGKLRSIGVCNESPWGVMRYLAEADLTGLTRISSVQNSYSLLDRHFEQGLAEIAVREQVGLIGYSPLSGGTLTGKYGDNPTPIDGSRSSQSDSFVKRLSHTRMDVIRSYSDLARVHGLEPAHLALAFARAQPFVTSVLMAASSSDQLSDNLGAIDVVISKEMLRSINEIHDAQPNPR